MTHDHESEQQPNERREQLRDKMVPVWTIEALVVKVDESGQHYVVTKVLEGSKALYETFFQPPLKTPVSGMVLGPNDTADASYGFLIKERTYTSALGENAGPLDTLLYDRDDIHVGDRLRVQRWNHETPSDTPNIWRVEQVESITILESGIDLVAEEARMRALKEFTRKNYAGILRRFEQLKLNERPSLVTEEPTLIAWRPTQYEEVNIARYTYGDGPIENHFVDIRATPYLPPRDGSFGGGERFTTSGTMFVARDIVADSPSKELARVDEPMVELSAHIWTETAFNPAVDAVRVDFIIDGVRYYAVKEFETSSSSFTSPGHDMRFEGYFVEGQENDSVEITEDERDAISEYNSIDHELTMTAVHLGIDARVTQAMIDSAHTKKELGQGQEPINVDAIITASSKLASINDALAQLEQLRVEALKKLQPVIKNIAARPTDTNLSIGGRLLIPAGKLQDVQVVMTTSDHKNRRSIA